MNKLYLLFVEDDIEPTVYGSFISETTRTVEARRLRKSHGPDHGIFKLDIDDNNTPYVEPYAGIFLDTLDPVMNNKNFVEEYGLVCPYCLRRNIILGKVIPIGNGQTWREIHCNECISNYYAKYNLVGFEVNIEGSP